MEQWPIDIQIVIDDKEFQKYLDEAIARAKNLTVPLKRCSIVMFQSFKENFREQGRPRRWKTLSRSTVLQRRRRSNRVLQDTGRLKMSVISRVGRGNIYVLRRDSLKMGTNLFVAPLLQYGTDPYTITPKSAPALKIPTPQGIIYRTRARHPGLSARPFVLFQPEDITECTAIFADYVEAS